VAADAEAIALRRGAAGPGRRGTGARSINATDARYEVKGTDLGIMWTDERCQILAAFGDTFGAGWAGPGGKAGDPAAIDWRSKTLARSSDRNPADGMFLNNFVTDRHNGDSALGLLSFRSVSASG
jgi:Domain of unknown function (DUF4185)